METKRVEIVIDVDGIIDDIRKHIPDSDCELQSGQVARITGCNQLRANQYVHKGYIPVKRRGTGGQFPFCRSAIWDLQAILRLRIMRELIDMGMGVKMASIIAEGEVEKLKRRGMN